MRAYTPRRSTVDLMAEILDVPGVAQVRPIAPHRSGGRFRNGGLRITLEPQGANPRGAYSDFTFAEAREWLAATAANRALDATPSSDEDGGAPDPIVERNPWGGQPYQGVDYPKGATFRLDDRRVRIVVVGRAGNYVVQDLDGNRPNASVHHSSLAAIPCSYDDGGDYCYSHDRRDDHRPDGRPVVNGYGFPA